MVVVALITVMLGGPWSSLGAAAREFLCVLAVAALTIFGAHADAAAASTSQLIDVALWQPVEAHECEMALLLIALAGLAFVPPVCARGRAPGSPFRPRLPAARGLPFMTIRFLDGQHGRRCSRTSWPRLPYVRACRIARSAALIRL